MNDMNWHAVLTEIVLLAMTCVIAMVDLWVKSERRTPTYLLSLATLVAVGALHLSHWQDGITLYAMQGMVVADPMGHLLALFATIASATTMPCIAYSVMPSCQCDRCSAPTATRVASDNR